MHGGLVYYDGSAEWEKVIYERRARLGQPFTATSTATGETYSSGVLWSEGVPSDNTAWPFIRPAGRLSTMHAPPPGTEYTITNPTWGQLAVYGWSQSNYAFDDGSAKTVRIPSTKADLTDDVVDFPPHSSVGYVYPAD